MSSSAKYASLSEAERQRLYGIRPKHEPIVTPPVWTNWTQYPACPTCGVKEGESCVVVFHNDGTHGEPMERPHAAREAHIQVEIEQAVIKALTGQTFTLTLTPASDNTPE